MANNGKGGRFTELAAAAEKQRALNEKNKALRAQLVKDKPKLTLADMVRQHLAAVIILSVVAFFVLVWGISSGVNATAHRDVYNLASAVAGARATHAAFLDRAASVNAKLKSGSAEEIYAYYNELLNFDIPEGLTAFKAAELDLVNYNYKAKTTGVDPQALEKAEKALSARINGAK